jgi:hypothetical protein
MRDVFYFRAALADAPPQAVLGVRIAKRRIRAPETHLSGGR